jgi:hypothetical protein
VILRRRRFAELVEQQLELFAVDEAPLLDELPAAEDAWIRADRDDAEDAYGDLQLVLDAIGERLLDLREAYAATLPDSSSDVYRVAFTRRARRRFGRAAALLEEEHA